LSNIPRPGETVAPTYNPSLPLEHSLSSELRRAASPALHGLPERKVEELECLRKELDSRDSTITELKNQLKNLQTIVEQLTKENSVLKTTSSVDDDQSMTSQASINDSSTSYALDGAKPAERGKSLETDQLALVDDETDARLSLKGAQRPVSMYEAREGPKNNWQVTKHQLTTLAGLDRSLTQAVLEPALPASDLVHRRAEPVTRAIQELWAAAREQQPQLAERSQDIRRCVRALLALFPQNCLDPELSATLRELRSASAELCAACGGSTGAPLQRVRSAAYELAKATKLLLAHFPS
ncbi:uncharacterized protein LOC114365678, partial [Ostrinia furnacalis]|uniref:uncharacterized protein LOC114365678 n=1 Tax=Ostrinia furnacalis TaxID=93504 RepID=UPI00103AA1FE